MTQYNFLAEDPALLDSLKTRLELGELLPDLSAGARDQAIADLLALRNNSLESDPFGLDSRVVEEARPVILVDGDQQNLSKLTAWLSAWREGLPEYVEPLAKAVCRVEVLNSQIYKDIGTAWLLAENRVVTNAHVVKKFATTEGAGHRFLKNSQGADLAVQVDFSATPGSPSSLASAVMSVEYLEIDEHPDLAVLRLAAGSRPDVQPIVVPTESQVPDTVAVLGYPDEPTTRVGALERSNYDGHYERKSLLPGKVRYRDASNQLFYHDCSTRPGNSGSPVVNFEDGSLVGIHIGYDRERKLNIGLSVAGMSQRLQPFTDS